MPTRPSEADLRALAARALAAAGERAQATACWELRANDRGATALESTWVEICRLDRGVGRARTDDVSEAGLAEAAERAGQAAADGAEPFSGEPPEPAPGRAHAGWDPVALTGAGEAMETASAGAPAQARVTWRVAAARTAIRSTTGIDAFEQRSFAHLRLTHSVDHRTRTAALTSTGPQGVGAEAVAALLPAGGDRAPERLDAGERPVVLGPEAVAVIIDLVRPHFGSLAAEGASAVAERLGKRVVAPCINLSDSPRYPGTLPRSYDAEGLPRQPLPLVQDGVAHRVVRDSATPGGPSTGHATRPFAAAPAAEHLVLVGGGAADEDELMRPMTDGVYIPALSRDGGVALGAFHIEGGRRGAPLLDARVAVDGLGVLATAQALTMGQRLVAFEGDSARTVGAAVCPGLRAAGGITFL